MMPAIVKLIGNIQDGLMPTEKIIRVLNADGDIEEISVFASNISDNKLLASEIGRQEDRVLVELPRESASGRWRIWVKDTAIAAGA